MCGKITAINNTTPVIKQKYVNSKYGRVKKANIGTPNLNRIVKNLCFFNKNFATGFNSAPPSFKK